MGDSMWKFVIACYYQHMIRVCIKNNKMLLAKSYIDALEHLYGWDD
jgi:hypothetical protein